jgi:cyclophilin family peptidyl-prolyl cis-trans isomerase
MKRLLYVALTLILAAGCAGDPVNTAKDKVPATKTKKEPSGEKNPVVVMKTSLGTIKIELFSEDTPITVKNFLQYVDDKFYDGTVFHRVIPGFMIQGGGFEKGLEEVKSAEDLLAKEKKTRPEIENESALSNVRGTIAMARKQDPNSASAQFYINVADNSSKLDAPRYCVFGKVIEGMDVVDKIKEVETRTIRPRDRGRYPPFGDVPVKDVVIESIRRADKADKKK